MLCGGEGAKEKEERAGLQQRAAILTQTRGPIEKNVFADGDTVAGNESGLRNAASVDEGASGAIPIHYAMASGPGAKDAMLPGCGGVVQSDRRRGRAAGTEVGAAQREAESRELAFHCD